VRGVVRDDPEDERRVEGRPDDADDAGEVAALRDEIDSVERAALRTVDPGARAVVIAGAVMLLLVAALLPWIGGSSGFDVLRGTTDPALDVGVLPRLFAAMALAFGVVLSVLALLSRRWGLVWASALGCAYCVVDGVWAIWARQTTDGPGPGVGMVLAVLAVLVLASQWLRLAWSRN
jgi:hypothetical protein